MRSATVQPSIPLPAGQAAVLRSLYDYRFLRKCRPFPASEAHEPRCAPSVPVYQLRAECGDGVDVEASLAVLCAKGLAMKAPKWCAPSGTWTFADGRTLVVSIEIRRTPDGSCLYEGQASVDGQAYGLGDVQAACFDLTPEGAQIAESLGVPLGSGGMGTPGTSATLGFRYDHPLPPRWGGDWITHGKAAEILGYVSRQSGVPSGEALRKAIEGADEGAPFAMLRDRTGRCAKHPKTGRLRRQAVEWAARERAAFAAAAALPPMRPKRGETRSEHARNTE